MRRHVIDAPRGARPLNLWSSISVVTFLRAAYPDTLARGPPAVPSHARGPGARGRPFIFGLFVGRLRARGEACEVPQKKNEFEPMTLICVRVFTKIISGIGFMASGRLERGLR